MHAARLLALLLVIVTVALCASQCGPTSGTGAGTLDIAVDLGNSTLTDIESQLKTLTEFRKSDNGEGAFMYSKYSLQVHVFVRQSDGKVTALSVWDIGHPGEPTLGIKGVMIHETKSQVESVLGSGSANQDGMTVTYDGKESNTEWEIMYGVSSNGAMTITYRLKGQNLSLPF